MNKQKTQSGSAHLIIIIVLAIVLIGVLGYVYWKNFLQIKSVARQNASTSTIKNDTNNQINASDIIDRIQKTLPTNFNISKDYIGVEYKVTGYSYYTSISSLSKSLEGKVAYDKSADVVSSVSQLLIGDGFIERNIQNGDGEGMYISIYKNASIICETTVSKYYQQPLADHTVQIICEDIPTFLEAAKKQKPFFESYTKSRGNFSVAMIGDPNISESKTSGYFTATIGIGGVEDETNDISVPGNGDKASFYKSLDQDWHFFRVLQAMPLCSDFNTNDLKKAYLGEDCLNSNINSQINKVVNI